MELVLDIWVDKRYKVNRKHVLDGISMLAPIATEPDLQELSD
jgi:hypothetical protein